MPHTLVHHFVVENLKKAIAERRLTFDDERLEDQLLGYNDGPKVAPTLQGLVLQLTRFDVGEIRISDIVRPGSLGRHGSGRAVDIGNEEIAGALLPSLATDSQVRALGIDQISFDASVADPRNDPQIWNYLGGRKFDRYPGLVLRAHRNHIHLSVLW
jgi:hypothetical protein